MLVGADLVPGDEVGAGLWRGRDSLHVACLGL